MVGRSGWGGSTRTRPAFGLVWSRTWGKQGWFVSFTVPEPCDPNGMSAWNAWQVGLEGDQVHALERIEGQPMHGSGRPRICGERFPSPTRLRRHWIAAEKLSIAGGLTATTTSSSLGLGRRSTRPTSSTPGPAGRSRTSFGVTRSAWAAAPLPSHAHPQKVPVTTVHVVPGHYPLGTPSGPAVTF